MSAPAAAPAHRRPPDLVPGARIPLADVGSFAAPLRRLRLVRVALAGALLLVAAAAFLSARGLSAPAGAVVGGERQGVIVLDVSASIEAATYEQREAFQQTARVLTEAAASGGRYGLVLFSDVAYEALPATTPAHELRAFLRYFVPLSREEAARRYRTLRLGGSGFAAGPWAHAFTGGTQISTGLRLARTLIDRDRLRDPTVVLVSDLDTDDSDVPALTTTVLRYGRAGIPLEVVGVGAAEADKELFRRLLGRARVADPRPLRSSGEVSAVAAARFPRELVALSALLLVLLGVNELACGRVGLRRRVVA